jgi:biopolymer transport protein ExbD
MKLPISVCLVLLVIQSSSEGASSNSDKAIAPPMPNLPKPAAIEQPQEEAKVEDDAVNLYVSVSGELKLEGKKTSERKLVRELKALVAKNKDLKVKIRYHVFTRQELLMRAMELCQGAGVWNLSAASDK